MMNLAEPYAHHARARPDHRAIVERDRVILYRDLDPLVRRTAAHIASFDLGPGGILGIGLKDHADHLIALVAAARLGVAVLPMDCRWTAEEMARVAGFFGAARVLVEPGVKIPGVETIALDGAWHAGVAAAPADKVFPTGGDLPLLLSLSSGTTGMPKGPMITHGHMLRRFWTHWINLNFNAGDRYVSATPMYFGGGRTFCMSQLFSGGTVILFPPPHEPDALVAEIARHDATSLFLVPTQLRRLLQLPDAVVAPMRRMRLLLSSGSALHPEERRAIRARLCPSFFEYYASTEGGGVSLLTPADQDIHPDSVGRSVFQVDVEIVDDAHHPVPPGTIGRLRYRNPGGATSFYNDPAASAEAFRDGWFYPGDLAAMNDKGYVFLRGRAKDMIIRGGVNIYPAEIEAILLAHPAVAEAAVVGWPSKEYGEEARSLVIASPLVLADELTAHCRDRLASYKAPRAVHFVDEMPKNSAGKIVKPALVARLTPR